MINVADDQEQQIKPFFSRSNWDKLGLDQIRLSLDPNAHADDQ